MYVITNLSAFKRLGKAITGTNVYVYACHQVNLQRKEILAEVFFQQIIGLVTSISNISTYLTKYRCTVNVVTCDTEAY